MADAVVLGPAMSAIIIDASGPIYRFYYASLNSDEASKTYVDGRDVTALHSFVKLLFRIRAGQFGGYRPDHIVMAMDSRGGSIRREIYPPYKANRSEKPEDLKWQLGQLPRISDAFGIKVSSEPGYEADDVIAGHVRQLREVGEREVVIISSDKDLLQLVGRGVVLSPPDMGTTDGSVAILTEKQAEDKFGVPPFLIADAQALSGDSTDGIPGAPGIGAVSAAALIQQFGSLDAVLANAHLIPKHKQRETLMKPDVQDIVRTSRRLVHLYDDLLLPDIGDFRPDENWLPSAEAYCLSIGATGIARKIAEL